MLVAKDAMDGSHRHISEVANGLACGCNCFGCNRQLIARNAEKSVPTPSHTALRTWW